MGDGTAGGVPLKLGTHENVTRHAMAERGGLSYQAKIII
jgi:hypothetical protein